MNDKAQVNNICETWFYHVRNKFKEKMDDRWMSSPELVMRRNPLRLVPIGTSLMR